MSFMTGDGRLGVRKSVLCRNPEPSADGSRFCKSPESKRVCIELIFKDTSGLIVDVLSRRLCFPFRSECAEGRQCFFPKFCKEDSKNVCLWCYGEALRSNSLLVFHAVYIQLFRSSRNTDEPTTRKSQDVTYMQAIRIWQGDGCFNFHVPPARTSGRVLGTWRAEK